MSARPGVTLIELLVALVVVAVLVGLAASEVRSKSAPATRPDDLRAIVSESQRDAIRAGRPITAVVVRHDRVLAVTVTEDGAVFADSELTAPQSAGDTIHRASR